MMFRPRIGWLMALVVVTALGVKGGLILREWRALESRRRAIDGLGFFTTPSDFKESELVDALGDPQLHGSALWGLDELGSASHALVQSLVDQLETETEKLQFENRRNFRQVDPAKALIRIKLPVEVIVPRLQKASASEDRWIRLQALAVLGEVAGRPGTSSPILTSLLLTALQDHEPAIRMRASQALIGLDRETRDIAITILMKQLNGKDWSTQLYAVISLAGFNPDGQQAVEGLAHRLQAGSVTSRLSVLYLIGKLGPVARGAVPAIVRTMMSLDAGENVPFFLNGFGSQGESWHMSEIPDSTESCQTPSSLGSLGATVLSQIGPEAEREAVEILVGMTRSEDKSERVRAAEALGAVGPRSGAFLTVRTLAEREIRVTPEEQEQTVIRLLTALEKVGEGDSRLVDALIRFLKLTEHETNWVAAMVLGRINPPPPAAVPALIDALKDKTQSVRSGAATALGRYHGQEREAAIPALLDALADKDEWGRAFAARALAELQADADRVVPTILPMLKSKDSNLRYFAAETLGRFGPAAVAAVPSLREAQRDTMKTDQVVIEQALRAILTSEPTDSDKASDR